MVIPYSYYTPEAILEEYRNGKISLAGAISTLKIRRDYYRRVINGRAADINYPITAEEAEEKIGALEDAIEILRTILCPPELTIDLTGVRGKLREIRDRCMVGDCTKEAALALFEQTWLDFKNDTILKTSLDLGASQQSVLMREIGQNIENAPEVKDIINGIRTEIERIQEPAPDTPPLDILTDADCIKRLEDTGFITRNTNITNKIAYAKTRSVTVPKIHRELIEMTNDSERAERIMRNNISGVEAGLKQYLFRLSRRNKK